VHPYAEVTWVTRDAVIAHGDKIKFQQKGVEFPEFWTPDAINITVSKYFRGKLDTPARETSLKQMITRVVSVFRAWGTKNSYFTSEAEAEIFDHELTYILLHQMASFNSPVWFNVGTEESQQCSACFILNVEDNMPSILEWISTEGMIFKRGSGAGISLSKLRSARESLTAGGKASGPVSFMRGADSVAGMIASGGVTRRAAKMVVLGIDHPDIPEFINCKAEEEDKIRALAEAGYNMADLNDLAWKSIQFQNANNSVRVTDDFMKAVEQNGEWQTHFVRNGEVADTYKARDLMGQIAQAAWKCGDPGVQFDTTINNWHTIPACGRIEATNPCAEYNSVNESACNLASINLLKYLRPDGSFKTEDFRATVDTMILAQDISVCESSFPTDRITRNARAQRQLGLGFANLGALLMTKGLAYDSDEARAWTGAITSVMGGEAYRYSTVLAERVGTFEDYAPNAKAMQHVIGMHRDASGKVNYSLVSDKKLTEAAQAVWNEACARGEEFGYRNAQATVIAPTGTISFMMGCTTTGPEPCFSLVAMKQLVGGGWMKLVNHEVEEALRRLGYTEEQCKEMVEYIVQNQTIEGAPYLKSEHLSIFDCAVAAGNGARSISWQGHVKMVAAIQPFISGAISKTFNMPHETTVEDIEEAYMMAWKLGIKVFAVYRDGSKATQPLQTAGQKKGKASTTEAAEAAAPERLPESWRHRMPATRVSETHKFSVAGHEGFLTYSMYEDGTLGEIFIRMAKTGSAMGGLLDAFALAVSLTLQYGVPLKKLVRKFISTRFEPAGFTDNPDIQIATSLTDYIFRYLAIRFLTPVELEDLGIAVPHHKLAAEATEANAPAETVVATQAVNTAPAPVAQTLVSEPTKPKIADTLCRSCGGMMIRTGSCNTCLQCGTSSGGC
jgi:ribonucleoside-diphosphate reductase alpha chain